MPYPNFRCLRQFTLLCAVVIALFFVLNANAQRSVLDEMAPQLVIEKTTIADIMKKERRVHKTRKQTVFNTDRTFTAFVINIFYEDTQEDCDCLFIKDQRTGQVYDVGGIFDTGGFPVKKLVWTNRHILSFEAHRDDTDDVFQFAIDVKIMKLVTARRISTQGAYV